MKTRQYTNIMRRRVIPSAFLALTTLLFTASNALALNAGNEMGASAQRLANLLNGNVMHVIMIVGLAVAVVMSFHKSTFVPVVVGIGSGVLYGFAHTWIGATFAVCV